MRELLTKPLVHNDEPVGFANWNLPLARTRGAAILVLLSAVFIYLQVFVLPWTPSLATGDQAIYLHHATRMLQGEMIYRDYDHFTFPGTDVLYAGLFRLFGVRAWIPQAMLVLIGTSLVWLIISVSKRLMSGSAVYLPALIFVALPFSSYLDATHHWYGLVAIMTALLVLLEEKTLRRLLCAGALVGIATFFTQSMAVVVVGFTLFLFWERNLEKQPWNRFVVEAISLFTGFVTTIAGCMAYFVWKVGVKAIVYYTIIFVAKYYPADWFNNWRVYLTGRPRLHAWTSWLDLPAFGLIHAIVPLIYVFFLVYSVSRGKSRHDEQSRRLMLISITGVFLFLTIASAPAYSRLYVISPPALVLLVFALEALPKGRRSMLCLAWIMVCVVLMVRPTVTQLRWKAYLDMPTGRIAVFEPVLYEKCAWFAERTHPSEYFFGDHMIAFVLELHNVARVPFLRPTDYTRPEEVVDVVNKLEKYQVRFVSWYIGLDREKDATRHPEGNHLALIRQYLHQHYHIAQTFSNGDQVWERNP